MNRIALLSSLLFTGALVFACASNDGSSAEPTDQTDQQGEDLKKGKKCGAFLHGECPSGYWCDMSGVPAGNVGGAGVCKKERTCILNGVYVCPPGETFDTSVCHCK